MQLMKRSPRSLDADTIAFLASIENLPFWLKTLVGAFPQQKPNILTYGVLESQLADIDEATMLEAVKAYVAENKYWPAVSELRKYTERVQLNQQWQGPFHLWHKTWALENWTLCPGPCEELTPDISACPFCEDMKVTI